MAVVILGGLLAASLVNLFVVPPLYLALGRRRRGPGGEQAVPSVGVTGAPNGFRP